MTAPITVGAGLLDGIVRVLKGATEPIAAADEWAACLLASGANTGTPCTNATIDTYGEAVGVCSAQIVEKYPDQWEVISSGVKKVCEEHNFGRSCTDVRVKCGAWNKLAGNAGSLTMLATTALLVLTL